MAEVAEHLVPTDGVSDYTIGLESVQNVGGAANFVFAITERTPALEPIRMGKIEILVEPPQSGDLHDLYVEAHRGLTDALRQMLFMADGLRAAVERKTPAPGNP